MPIDIKWVRHNPKQVEEWQRLRGTRKSRESDVVENVVNNVLQQDEQCRKHLYTIQQYKKQVKKIQQQLRPLTRSTNREDETNDEEEESLVKLRQQRRQELLQEKKHIENQIQHLQLQWTQSSEETQKALWKLGSPIIIKQDKQDDSEIVVEEVRPPSLSFLVDIGNNANNAATTTTARRRLSSLGMTIQHTWKQYTMEYFASIYSSMIELPRGIRVVAVEEEAKTKTNSTTFTNHSVIDVDTAHAIWGCNNYEVDSSADDGTTPAANNSDDDEHWSCPLCWISSSSSSQQPPKPSPRSVMLPTWIQLLKDYVPTKSIWGDKQLPVFTGVWSNHPTATTDDCGGDKDDDDDILWLNSRCHRRRNKNEKKTKNVSLQSQFSLELIALTASSIVDACEIQNDIAREVKEYYAGLLVEDDDNSSSSSSSSESSSRIVIHHVQPPDLNIHEWNRMEIHAKTLRSSRPQQEGETRLLQDEESPRSLCQTVCLGWVSIWGDAASRTFDMAFAGGGVRTTGKQSKSSKQVSKDYVYVVQASVVDPSTWEKIIFLNHINSTSQECGSQNVTMLVGIPPAMKPSLHGLVTPLMTTTKSNGLGEVDWISVHYLTVDSCKKNKKKQSVFGPMRETSMRTQRLSPRHQNDSNAAVTPKFPPILGRKLNDGSEALSCPFGFLFP